MHCRAVEDAWGEAALALPRPWDCIVRCPSTPPHHACSFFPMQGASLTRWVAPRMPGQPRCSASPWQKDTPSLCSAWMPPMSCFSLGPKVRDEQRWGRWPADVVEQVGMGEYVKCRTPWGWFLLGLSRVLSVEPCPALPQFWGWLAPFLWPCGWGEAMLRRGIAPPPPCPWRDPS